MAALPEGALPAGTVTFLFTDIEDSTRIWESHPESMRSALERHDAIMRGAVEDHAGHVFRTVGDSFCAAFSNGVEALGAAIDAQRRLHTEDWSALEPGFPGLLVRMCLHSGDADLTEAGYAGPTLARVALLEAAGNGGQVLMSTATRMLLRDSLPDGVRLRDLGAHRLRDRRSTERITQVVATDMPDVHRPLRTAHGLTASDRIVVTGDDGDGDGGESRAVWARTPRRRTDETLAAVHDVVMGRADTVTLTPEQAREAAQKRPVDLAEYRLGRVAEWCQPRYRLDERFVDLALMTDLGEESLQGRWKLSGDRFAGLREMLSAVPDPVVVVLGPPGAGKSTLLRHLELQTAVDGLRGQDRRDSLTYLVSLGQYKPESPGGPLPAPREWLCARWRERYPDLPSLDVLLGAGRMLLLLDALNEMPAESEAEFLDMVALWKDFLVRLTEGSPGNRVVFSCRTLDYSAPLSTPRLRVPQAAIEPLSDEQVRDFLKVHSPLHWRSAWQVLDGSDRLEVLRSPYFLKLLTEQVEQDGSVPDGRAELLTGLVRHALRRELQHGRKPFQPGRLLSARDVRQVTSWQWRTACDLPGRGVLVPKLAELAYDMQRNQADGERAQVRLGFEQALGLLDDDDAEAIVEAGTALALLDEDAASGELMFVHQLVQEYFAARRLALSPEPELARDEWRRASVELSVDEVVDGLGPADPLPMLPQTGWEETTLLAAAMVWDLDGFVRQVADANLVLAGRCATQPDVGPRLSETSLERLRWDLVNRSRDPEADLRHRVACGRAVGVLGDPRFELRQGPYGDYLMPPLVDIQGGAYWIGDDSELEVAGTVTAAHAPRHRVELGSFAIGKFPVTNAEWALFMASGGYEEEAWWDTESARLWRSGEGTGAGYHANLRYWRARFEALPDMLDGLHANGAVADEFYELWRKRLAMSEPAFEDHIREMYPGGRLTEPRHWGDSRYNGANQPVAGVSWYEVRAYCSWLGAQTGMPFRQPTEVEWEAAARGRLGRRYAYGDVFDRFRGNTLETHIRATTPVGVFPEGDTPDGVCDMTGNTWTRTSSAWGEDPDDTAFPYPYDAADGREDAETHADMRRVARGGSHNGDRSYAPAVLRVGEHPAGGNDFLGLRLVVSPPSDA